MKIQLVKDYQQLSFEAANLIASQVILKRNSTLGLATGSTPEGMYKHLVEMNRQGSVDFSKVTTFNLDEYLGIPPEHPQSYHYYMYHHFFNHVNIPPDHINIPPGKTKNPLQVCRDYDQRIEEAGGIDLQILGIGVNGHIGFNEPGEYLKVPTQVVELHEDTIEANSRFFNDTQEVPRKAITMGMGPIMHSQKILLMASGKNKALAIKNSVNGQVSTRVPASFLQLHRDVLLIIDQEAASLL